MRLIDNTATCQACALSADGDVVMILMFVEQMDKFALEGKVKDLETKIKEQTKKIQDLTDASNSSKQVTIFSPALYATSC